MKIYCLGNEDIEFDSMAKKIAESLQITGVEFLKTDSLDAATGDIIILDVIKGMTDVVLIENIDKIRDFYPVSAHDFDLGTELKLKKAIGEINSVKIIGVPMQGNIEEIKEKVKNIIYSQIKAKFPVIWPNL